MATGWIVSFTPSSLSKSAKTGEDQPNMTCSVCLEEFRDPKLLPCCHTFCTECLEGLVTKYPKKPEAPNPFRQGPIQDEITCPQCRTRHMLPSQGGVCAFLADYTVIQEQENRQWQGVLQKRNKCGVCEHDGVTVSFCEDCESFLCNYCAGAHRRMKMFSSHQVSSLSSLELQKVKPKPKPVTCQIHPDCCVSFYCATCCQLICNECVATKRTVSSDKEIGPTTTNNNHQSHVLHILSEDSLMPLEGKLSQLLTSVSEQKEESQKKLLSIENVEKNLASRTELLKKSLIEQVEKHIQELQKQCELDLKQIDEKHASMLEGCKATKSTLKRNIPRLTMKEQFASKAQNCSGKTPRIAMIAKAASELEKPEALPRGYYPSSPSTMSALNDLPLIVRNLSADLKKTGLIRSVTGSDFTCSTSKSNYSALTLFGKRLQLGNKSQVTVKASVQPVGTPQFKVIYGRSCRVLPTTVQKTADGAWLLECTPTCNGTHTIRVCVFGHWIEESVPTFTVDGELKEGDIVRRGPDSTSTAEDFLKIKGKDVEMADVSWYNVGKLTKVTRTYIGKSLSSTYHVEVTWGHDSAKPLVEEMSFTWSGYSGFPIELAP